MKNGYYYRQTLPQRETIDSQLVKANGTNNLEKMPEVFIENDFHANLGHNAIFHMSFPDSVKERDMIFEGKIVEAGRDHVVLHNNANGVWYLLPLIYLNYAETKEKPKLFNNSIIGK